MNRLLSSLSHSLPCARRARATLRSLATVLLLGLASCGGAQGSGPERATEEALAATDSDPDTAAAAGSTGTWRQTDTTAGRAAPGDTTGAAGGRPAGGEAVTYQTYRNEKHGFSVRYPSGIMQPSSEVGNGNGRTFRAPDGSASLLAYATGQAMPQQVQRRFEEQTTNPALDITYRTRGDGWYVLSGYRDDNIFYERVEARDSTMKVMRIFYERSQEARFDPIVREVSNSLDG
jgi:hypothetical protein